jgi:hypothetical protein
MQTVPHREIFRSTCGHVPKYRWPHFFPLNGGNADGTHDERSVVRQGDARDRRRACGGTLPVTGPFRPAASGIKRGRSVSTSSRVRTTASGGRRRVGPVLPHQPCAARWSVTARVLSSRTSTLIRRSTMPQQRCDVWAVPERFSQRGEATSARLNRYRVTQPTTMSSSAVAMPGTSNSCRTERASAATETPSWAASACGTIDGRSSAERDDAHWRKGNGPRCATAPHLPT